MHATDSLGQVLSSGRRSFSFELFPPKTDEGERTLWQTVREIEALKPTFVSVTYGPDRRGDDPHAGGAPDLRGR
jgi:methylenetetrahydrofolate reductase (NADPH)